MNAKEKHQCKKEVWRDRPYYKYTMCKTPATIERDGGWFCKRHDPEEIAAMKAEKEASWAKERAVSRANARLYAAMRHFCEGLTIEFMENNRAARPGAGEP